MVKNNIRNKPRNPPGTDEIQWKCKFYPSFCSISGHKTSRSEECMMHLKVVEERDAAANNIQDDLVNE